MTHVVGVKERGPARSLAAGCLRGATALAARTCEILTLLSCALLLFVLPARAQEVGTNATQNAGELEEITVTARFRAEPLQRTPLAITAISGNALEERGATSVVDIAKFVPNVSINQLGAGFGPTVAANIRGIGLTDFKPVFEPGVPIYVDDVVLARATGALFDLLDLERVEVLRGPQGTLFGKNAAGGAIRLISRKPTGTGPGFLEGTAGDYNRIDVRGAFETALVKDRLFARFSFVSKKRDGFVDVLDFACQMGLQGTPQLAGTLPRTTSGPGSGRGCKVDELGNQNVQAARVAMRLTPAEALEFNLTGDISDDQSKGPADKTLGINSSLGLVTLFNNTIAIPKWGVAYDNRFITSSPFTNYSSFVDPGSGLATPNINHVLHWGVQGTADWRINHDLSLKAIVGHRKFTADFGRDSDGSPLAIDQTFDHFVHRQDSYEVRLSGGLFSGRTDWTLGAFKFKASDFQPDYVILFPGLLPQSNIDRIDNQDSDNWAAFAHAVNRLTDKLTLTAGVRYTHDEKTYTVIRQQRPSGTLLFPQTTVQTKANRTSPMVNLACQWTDDINTYVSWQRGFRGGGFNPRPATAAQVKAFDPEDLDSYEVGMKSEWFERRVRLNIAAFYVKYTNMQLPSVYVDSNGSVTFPPLNAGKAHMDGVEVEFQASPIARFLVDGSVGYLGFRYEDLGRADPDFIRATPGLTPAQADANAKAAPCKQCRPVNAPEWTGALGAQYTVPLGGSGSLALRTDYKYQTRAFFAVNNLTRSSQPGYGVLNAHLTWQSADDAWGAVLSGTNLTNKLYLTGALDFYDSLGTNEGAYGRPREWAITVKRRF